MTRLRNRRWASVLVILVFAPPGRGIWEAVRQGLWASLLVLAAHGSASPLHAEADLKRGAEGYRVCVACHSLEPGSHLTGPSLAGAWGRKAGTADGYIRYSKELKASGIVWDEDTLNAWLADPAALVPGTYMILPQGYKDDPLRADLIAFLAIAMGPDGAKKVVEQEIVPDAYVKGQVPEPLAPAAAASQVTGIRHCKDSYFIATADGAERPYWEMNVRLKVDSRATGPEAGKPVITGAGMMGDRVSVVFSSVAELNRLVVEKC